MNNAEIEKLVDDLDAVDFREFWWDSKLLDRCAQIKDSRVVKVLCIRHHCLQNKQADSCHVIRNTIKIIDGPAFPYLWQFIAAESDQQRLINTVDDPHSLPWAAAFVLGEIGGKPALSETTGKLANPTIPYLWVRIAMHLVVRYLQILSEEEPQVEEMDVKTGAMMRFPAKDRYPDVYERQMLRRRQANEYFTPVDPVMVPYLKAHLNRIPETYYPMSKAELLKYCDHLPTQKE
jgi:2-methylcitrate dehydratase PrpD